MDTHNLLHTWGGKETVPITSGAAWKISLMNNLEETWSINLITKECREN